MKTMNKKFRVALAAGLLFSMLFLTGFQLSVTFPSQAEDKEWNIETYLDLIGTINYTYDPTGNTYTPLLSSSSSGQHSQISFALSVGANKVFYWIDSRTGEPLRSIEEMYESYAEPVLLWEKQGSYDALDLSNPVIQAGVAQSTYQQNDNLTVNTLDEDTTDQNDIRPIDMIGDNISVLEAVTLVKPATDSEYSKYFNEIVDWTDADELYEDPVDAKELQIVGAENVSQIIFSWLARYIEDVKGYDVYTVKVDEGTENVTSEAFTIDMDEETALAIRDLVDEAMAEEQVTTPASIIDALREFFGVPKEANAGIRNLGSTVVKKIASKGTFSFSTGISMSQLKAKASTVRDAAKTATSKTGGLLKKVAVSAALAAKPVTKIGFLGYKASGKVTQAIVDATGKLKNTKLAFLGGPIKLIGKTVSYILKYWWLIGLIVAAAFIMFATPVGPYMYSKTIRKVF